MRTWHFYRLEDGHFVGHHVSADEGCSSDLDAWARRNAPVGCGAIETCADFNFRSSRVIDGVVVQGLDPGGTHAERELKRAAALHEIGFLEAKQARRVRELLSASDPVLTEIDDRIRALRANL